MADLLRLAGAGQVVGGEFAVDDVGQQKDQQRRADERHSADRQVGLEQRPADHQRIQHQPHQKTAANDEQPDVAGLLDAVEVFGQAVLDQQQPRRQQDQADQVEVADTEQAAEFEEQADRQQRRQVDPGRRIDFVILKQDIVHALPALGVRVSRFPRHVLLA